MFSSFFVKFLLYSLVIFKIIFVFQNIYLAFINFYFSFGIFRRDFHLDLLLWMASLKQVYSFVLLLLLLLSLSV